MENMKGIYMMNGHYLIWTYIIGFDHTLPDCGIGRYLERIGRKPDGFCALVLHTDFVHLHWGMDFEYELSPDMCGFRGDARKLAYLESKQLSCTNFNIRRLVRELHKSDIKMYINLMGIYQSDLFHEEWLSHHQELRLQTIRGIHALNALKRLKDGTWYEDFFLDKLRQVMLDYELDGVHLADCFCPLPAPLAACDYSGDMVSQFIDYSGVRIPEELLACLSSDDDTAKKVRAEWIWRYKREEWIRFYDWRWNVFYKKLCGILHPIGREVATIGMYVSDPFQSYYPWA